MTGRLSCAHNWCMTLPGVYVIRDHALEQTGRTLGNRRAMRQLRKPMAEHWGIDPKTGGRPGRSETHEQRARRFGAKVIEDGLNVATVVARDGMNCAYCGKVTVRATSWPLKPDAATLDHVIPLSRGGNHSRANAVLACWSCNSKKGVREKP